MNVKILSHNYNLEFEHGVNQHYDSIGYLDFHEMKIKIDKDAPLSRQRETMCHEIFEGLNLHGDLGLDHNQITKLGELFALFIRANQYNLLPMWQFGADIKDV